MRTILYTVLLSSCSILATNTEDPLFRLRDRYKDKRLVVPGPVHMADISTEYLDRHAEKLGIQKRTNPYAGTIATVRTGSSIVPEESRAVEKRFGLVKNSIKKFLNINNLSDNSTPRIALCCSGGGMRAALSTLGALIGAEGIGLLDCILYSATLSGSSWLMNAVLSGDNPDRSVLDNLLCYHEHLSEKLHGLFANLDSFQISQMTDHLLYKFYYRQAATIVDIWGVEVGRMILQHLGNYWQKATLSSQAEVVETGRYPFPLYTAIYPMKKGRYEWFEFSPYEVWSEYLQAGVPTWSFGRTFKKGVSTNSIAEQSLAYYLGIFGSAFEIEWGPYLEALANNLRSIILKSIIWLLMKAGMADMRLNPARLANFTYGMPGSPMEKTQEVVLIDAGLDVNLPAAPLLRSERDIDVIIFVDASFTIDGSPALFDIERYARKQGYAIPDICGARAGEERVTVFEGDEARPTFVYIPRASNTDFDPCFDSNYETECGFAHTYNFRYTREQADKVCGLMEANMRECKDTIIEVLRRAIERRESRADDA